MGIRVGGSRGRRKILTGKLSRFPLLAATILSLSACGTPTPHSLPAAPSPSSSPQSAWTATPGATRSPTETPTAAYSPPAPLTSAVSSVPVPGATINRIAMDDNSLYWTTGGGGYLFRHPFDGPAAAPNTILAITHFSQGRLSPYPMPSLFRIGDWLIFDDRQFAERSSGWAIRAFNVVTSTDTILVRNQASNVLYSFSTDGEWLVWISGDLTTGTSVTSLNLRTGDRREIARSDLLSDGWEEVSVSAGRAVATRIAPDARTVYLFDLKTGQSRKLAVDASGSDMAGMTFDGNWIAWKMGTNFQGSTALYNVETAATGIFPDWGMQPVLAGRWLTWDPGYEKPLYAVNLDTLERYLVAETEPGEELTAAAVHGDRIAWGRLHFNLPNRSSVNSAVEWRALP